MNRSVYVLASAALVRNLGRAASWLFLPIVLAVDYRLPLFVVGLLIAAVVPVSVVGNLLGGVVSDRYGRLRLAVFPSFASALFLFLLFEFLNLGVGIVMGLWAATAFMMALSGPAQSAMIGDVTAVAERPTAFAIQRVLSNLGFAVSPALGGLLAATYGLPWLYLAAGVATLAEGIILWTFLEESRPGAPLASERPPVRGSLLAPFQDRAFLLLLLVMGGLTVIANQFGTPLSLYLVTIRSLSTFDYGLVFALNGALVVIFQIPIGRLIERTHRYLSWLAVGTLVYGIGFLGFGFGTTFPEFLAAMAVVTTGENIVSPVRQATVANYGGTERRGAYFGAYDGVTSAMRSVAPVVGTLLLSVDPSLLWGAVFVFSVVVGAAFLRLGRTASERAEGRVPSRVTLSTAAAEPSATR
jgi:MFS family permease